jgi:hypothetical protein
LCETFNIHIPNFIYYLLTVQKILIVQKWWWEEELNYTEKNNDKASDVRRSVWYGRTIVAWDGGVGGICCNPYNY